MIFGKNTYITALQQNYATGSDLFYLEQSTSVPTDAKRWQYNIRGWSFLKPDSGKRSRFCYGNSWAAEVEAMLKQVCVRTFTL